MEATSTTPSIWLRDRGLDGRTYDQAALLKGEGRWVLEALSKVDATEENTSMAGAEGTVTGDDGTAFSYFWSRDKWSLQGVDQHK